MKKWQKVLVTMFATVAVGVTIGMSNTMTASAREVHRSHGVEGNPATATQSRAWGLMAGSHGQSFRVHHYRRGNNGALTLLRSSNWGSHAHTRVHTSWVVENRLMTASRLEGTAW